MINRNLGQEATGKLAAQGFDFQPFPDLEDAVNGDIEFSGRASWWSWERLRVGGRGRWFERCLCLWRAWCSGWTWLLGISLLRFSLSARECGERVIMVSGHREALLCVSEMLRDRKWNGDTVKIYHVAFALLMSYRNVS